MRIYDEKVNHLENPIGFAMDETVFSWKVSEAKGQRQKAARVVVARDVSLSDVIVDTGWTADADSLGFSVSVPLSPRFRYYWNVSVRDDAGDEATGDVQFFETGKRDEPWNAKWITCDNANPRHPYFTRTINIKKPVSTTRLYICGLGLYEAEINGARVGDEYFTPYCNDYDKWVQAQTFDMTSLIQKAGGSAEISVLLGNGWYKSRYGYDALEEKGYYGDEWKLIAEIRITYEDGSVEIIGTDETWQVERSNITYSGIYDGERVDDTLKAEATVNAEACEPPKGKLEDRRSLPVRVQQELKPIELIHTPAGELVFDIGQEITGIFELRVDVPRGQQVHIQTGEILQGGNFYRDNLRTAKSEYIYISDGRPAVIRPKFTFYGYRYVKVEGAPDLKPEDFTALAMWSDIKDTGSIVTGHKLLNKFISNVRWGGRDNFLDIPTDCPQRDERMGWTGDAQVFTNTATYMSDTYAFYSKFLYDMGREQEDNKGAVPVVIPSAGHNDIVSVWGDAACIMPWNLYVLYGDKSILRQQYDSMKTWVEYVRAVDGDDHGWRKTLQLGDWLALDYPAAFDPERCMGGTDEGFIASVYYAASAEIVSKAAAVLGYTEDAENYKELSERIFNDVGHDYYTPGGRCAVDTQTGLVLTLKYHLSCDEEWTKARLRHLFECNDNKLRTGFVGTPLLCNVLTEYGMEDIAWKLLLNEDYPGWLREVKLGATTVWERWNSLDDDGKITGTSMNSMNHYAYGSVVEWIYRHVAGLNFTEAAVGCRKAVVEPLVNKDLQYADTTYDSPAGLWRSRWEYLDDSHVKINVTVPFGCSATLVLPGDGKGTQELVAGKYEFIIGGCASSAHEI